MAPDARVPAALVDDVDQVIVEHYHGFLMFAVFDDSSMFGYLEGCTRAKHRQQILAAAPVMSVLQGGMSANLRINLGTMIYEILHRARAASLTGHV